MDKQQCLAQLTELSQRYGRDEDYVLAGGGNTSCKVDGALYVKGSGTALATIRPEEFVAMDLGALAAMLLKDYPQDDAAREAASLADMMAARLPGEEQKRPSVEAILHALFPYRFVLHTHPALVNGLTCGKDGERICGELFAGLAAWVPLTKPGYILSLECNRMFGRIRQETGAYPKVAFLQNHGLFVAADTVEEIDRLMKQIMDALTQHVQTQPCFDAAKFDMEAACEIAPALRMLYGRDSAAIGVFCTNRQVLDLVRNRNAVQPLMTPFTPDHIVYCKGEPLVVRYGDDYRDAFDAYERKWGFYPKIVVVEGIGFFALGKNKKEADTAKALFLDAMKIAVYSESFGGPLPLTEDFTKFILSWEAESYRQKVALSGSVSKRLAGKVAIITGSAQGFGKGIAEAMAAEGAYIVVADLNHTGALECAGEINQTHGPGSSFPVSVNVAEEASVEAMVQAAVLAYGGVDILVSNAGVLVAGSLEEMTLDHFNFVTKVNYTGYFLCVKHCSVPMKIQRQYCPDYLMDIVEINSKSGLEGSNKNFAYAGSKFGGIGLTQSFALELVEHGIKVNAVCPGNLLDGPLWSDPERGLFRQYLDAGKVPGAKTIDDVRHFYESRVPMGRGCTTMDVARAIFYIVEQQYETGQAVPVTGGQVMLS